MRIVLGTTNGVVFDDFYMAHIPNVGDIVNVDGTRYLVEVREFIIPTKSDGERIVQLTCSPIAV